VSFCKDKQKGAARSGNLSGTFTRAGQQQMNKAVLFQKLLVILKK
jgi:hypothetical protein